MRPGDGRRVTIENENTGKGLTPRANHGTSYGGTGNGERVRPGEDRVRSDG